MATLQQKFKNMKASGNIGGAQELLQKVRGRYSNPSEQKAAVMLAGDINRFIRENKPGPDRLVLC